MMTMLPRPHPMIVRVTHWVNAFAVLIMVLSGWRIYNASPVFGFRFPDYLTLGGWLAGALQWHFAAMWLLVLNGLVYLTYNVVSGRLKAKLWPGLREVWRDGLDVLRLRLNHTDLERYNAVQKLAYLGVLAALIVVVASGLVVWKPVQFPLLRGLMGDYDGARVVHFCAMAAIVTFVAVHVVMVAVVPRTLNAMVGIFKA